MWLTKREALAALVGITYFVVFAVALVFSRQSDAAKVRPQPTCQFLSIRDPQVTGHRDETLRCQYHDEVCYIVYNTAGPTMSCFRKD